MANPSRTADFRGSFSKVDDERRLAFGWAYTCEQGGSVVVDKSGDFVDAEAMGDLEDAVYDYVLASREGDEMHVKLTGVAKIVESVMLTPDKLEKMGLSGDRLGWWVGFRVEDEAVWGKVKDGTYPMFSIRGSGTREPAE